MSELEINQEAMGLIAEAEKRLHCRIRDVIDEGTRLVFITEKGHLGQALGKEAKNLGMMRELLKKDVKFVEWDEDQQIFVRNLFKPFDLETVRMESVPIPETDGGGVRTRAIVEVVPDDKGKAIGKQGRNIASIRHIAKRHHEIDEVQVV